MPRRNCPPSPQSCPLDSLLPYLPGTTLKKLGDRYAPLRGPLGAHTSAHVTHFSRYVIVSEWAKIRLCPRFEFGLHQARPVTSTWGMRARPSSIGFLHGTTA